MPGNPGGVAVIADGCNGYACLMPMRRSGQKWTTVELGWGLIDARSRRTLDPRALATDMKIEMTDWEVHDFAVQIVRDYIVEKLGFELMSSQGNPNVDPSIWFVGPSGPEWVVVRAARFPLTNAALPANVRDIAESCANLSRIGHFASVAMAPLKGSRSTTAFRENTLWRGVATDVQFDGLAPISMN